MYTRNLNNEDFRGHVEIYLISWARGTTIEQMKIARLLGRAKRQWVGEPLATLREVRLFTEASLCMDVHDRSRLQERRCLKTHSMIRWLLAVETLHEVLCVLSSGFNNILVSAVSAWSSSFLHRSGFF